MLRPIAGIVGGLVAWPVMVTAIDWGLRPWRPGYAQAEHAEDPSRQGLTS
jgi:hypothetical protein